MASEQAATDAMSDSYRGMSSDNIKGLVLALSSSFFIGASFIVKKKGLKKAGASGVRAVHLASMRNTEADLHTSYESAFDAKLRIVGLGKLSGVGGYSYLYEPLWWTGMITISFLFISTDLVLDLLVELGSAVGLGCGYSLCCESSEGPIAAVRIAEKQSKISPTANNITAAAAAVVSPYPSAAMALKNPPDEVPFPKLSVASNGQPPKDHKVSILGETASECGLKVPDVFEDPYMGIVPVSVPPAPPLPSLPVLEFNSSSHVSSERQMNHSAKELCFSRLEEGESMTMNPCYRCPGELGRRREEGESVKGNQATRECQVVPEVMLLGEAVACSKADFDDLEEKMALLLSQVHNGCVGWKFAVLAHVILRERLHIFGILGCALCVVGSITIVLHAPQEREIESVKEVWDLATEPAFVFYAALVIAVVVVMSVKALGIALKLTLSGTNQLIYPQTWVFVMIVLSCVLTQMNYLNKALDTFNTAVVSPIYYVMFTSLTIVASVIMFKDWDRQNLTQIVTELCGFVTILSGTFLLHKTKDMADGCAVSRLPKHNNEDSFGEEGIPLKRQDTLRAT
ncbi:hypothetical protein SASPL_108380 [Salvia splendens]|uniref:Probable magnesium transporter n=1 Tax=Salvia splendens TaxID=180675 RepID=A0A8X9A7E3_SALSN|nr:hypothetical protein SASPL_108380 [Salvia splendens]